jgi:uncharacterized membrane protein
MMGNRVRIVGSAAVVAATTLLPWFREQRPGGPAVALNAWKGNWVWPTLALVALVAFVVTALYALANDIRWMAAAFAAGLVTFALYMTQCWIGHQPSMPNAKVVRRWGLFVALNAAFALGAVLKGVGDRVTAAWFGRDDLPSTTGYEFH